MNEQWICQAQEVLRIEIEALAHLVERLDSSFTAAVEMILRCKGRVVLAGMGKSGAVGRKIAGTLASTGTPALFLHPAEGMHGDVGMVTAEDVVIALSYSGETEELLAVLPALKRIGARLIALCGNPLSTLAAGSDIALDLSVPREACPLGLAPTASTTAMLALGDALAITVMQARRFTREDYARFHPAGALGRRLILRVADLMRTGEMVSVCRAEATVREVLFSITRAQAGASIVTDLEGKLVGIVTDGDIRRHLLTDENCLSRAAADIMTRRPKTIFPDHLAAESLKVMEEYRIGEMPVLDAAGRPQGMLNLKDLLKAGLV
ncbi:MAG: KpsF/GutQ family sugar-phosphate isomerase [Armatimonadetes bacterium]|nr:KpsF/GutQ family sugar-phosphate isomerase [Armatimonadota bacterium]